MPFSAKVKMKETELKVFYAGGLNKELDTALEQCLAKFGYKIRASGQELGINVRDLAFDKES